MSKLTGICTYSTACHHCQQKAEFEAAGFTDFDAKFKAWTDNEKRYIAGEKTSLPIYFSAPPVCTTRWNVQVWLRFVDWTLPANAKALEAARESIGR